MLVMATVDRPPSREPRTAVSQRDKAIENVACPPAHQTLDEALRTIFRQVNSRRSTVTYKRNASI